MAATDSTDAKKDAGAVDTDPTPTEIAQPKDPQEVHTVTDRLGIERLVPAGDPGWEPAPTDPDPEAVKRAEERNKDEKTSADTATTAGSKDSSPTSGSTSGSTDSKAKA